MPFRPTQFSDLCIPIYCSCPRAHLGSFITGFVADPYTKLVKACSPLCTHLELLGNYFQEAYIGSGACLFGSVLL